MDKVSKAAVTAILILVLACSTAKTPGGVTLHVIPKQTVKAEKRATEKEVIKKIGERKPREKRVVYSKPAKTISKVEAPGLRLSKKSYPLSVSYDKVSAYDLVVNIFKNVLKKNLVIDADLSFPLSLSIDGNFTEEELVSLLQLLLTQHGVYIAQKGNTYLVKSSRLRPKVLNTRGAFWWFYKPRYVSATDLYRVASSLASPMDSIRVIRGRVLLFSGPRDDLNSIARLVRLVDTDVFQGESIRIFRLLYSEPTEVSREIDRVMIASGMARELYSLIPVDRLGYLIAVTSSNSLMDRIEALVKVLDSQEEKKEKNIYIYRVQYVKVDKLYDTLKNLLSGRPTAGTPPKGKKKTTVIVSSEVKIVADKTNNALIIEASPEDYRKIKAIISELDVMPRQVLIEVLIAEITLNKQLENGVEWWLKVHGKSYTAEAASTFGLAGARNQLMGFTYYGIDPDHFWNFLYFLSTKSKITILSSPHILVRDNEEASIDVGQEVPILTMETVGTTQIQGSSAIDRRIEYRDVGVILKVKPHISQEGFITLEVSQETSSAEKNTVSGIDSPIILKRKVHTTLMVQDEHSVILGGIINRRTNIVNKKVPLLGDIPYLGKLFSYTSKEEDRTELIIMITPHVIRNIREADIISNLFEDRLRALMGRIRSK